MSHGCIPCRKEFPRQVVSNESTPSLVSNLTRSVYGAISKSLVGGKIAWAQPCNPSLPMEIDGLPRNPGEGLLCYFLRACAFLARQRTIASGVIKSVSAPLFPSDFSMLPGGAAPTGNSIYMAPRDINSFWSIASSDPEWKIINKAAEAAGDFVWDSGRSPETTRCTRTLVFERSFKNPYNATTTMHIAGFVDDDILINGVILDPTSYIYDCGLNGAHSFSTSMSVGPGEVTVLGCNNNFYTGIIQCSIHYDAP